MADVVLTASQPVVLIHRQPTQRVKVESSLSQPVNVTTS